MQATWKSETANQFYFLVIPPAVIKVRWLEYVVHIHTENFQRFICPCVVKNSDDQRSPFAWSTTIIRWLYPGGKVCVTGGHSTRVVLLRTKRGGKESLGTRLIHIWRYLYPGWQKFPQPIAGPNYVTSFFMSISYHFLHWPIRFVDLVGIIIMIN